MLFQEIIRRKRDGAALGADEIAAMVEGIASGKASEGQVAAFAMAVFFHGMTPRRSRRADAGDARFRRRVRTGTCPARWSTSIRPAASATMSR